MPHQSCRVINRSRPLAWRIAFAQGLVEKFLGLAYRAVKRHAAPQNEAMAAESVQPVPWLFVVSTRALESAFGFWPFSKASLLP